MIYFIAPAYNEASNLPILFSSIKTWSVSREESCHVILVDDGSRDATREVVGGYRDLPITLVSHGINRGVHEAFRSGFDAWSKLPTSAQDLVVTIEADNTSSLEILDTMVQNVRNGDDLVLASYYAPGGGVAGTSFHRRMLSYCANLILRCTPGMPDVRTFSSFYRVYRAPFLSYAMRAYGRRLIEEQGFVCVVEMLVKFGRVGARISEVPLQLDWANRRGASKMKVLGTIRGYLQLFVHAAFGRLASPSRHSVADPNAPKSISKGAGI